MYREPQDALWQRIKDYSPDEPGAAYSFSQKLAVQQGWSAAYTQRAIEEYKKFMYLCCVLPAGASPSPATDEVWHLHLTYTKSYWEDFCRNTLQQDIHHNPSKGGSEEKEKYASLYQDTLVNYRNYFGDPPADIWPQPGMPVIINHITQTEIPQSRPELYGQKKFFLPLLILLVPFVTCYFADGEANPYDLKGPQFLGFYLMLVVAGIIALVVQLFHKKKRIDDYIDSLLGNGLSVFTATKCFYGNDRLVRLCLLDLLTRDKIIANENREESFRVKDLRPDANEQNPLMPVLANQYLAGSEFTFYEAATLCIDDPLPDLLKTSLSELSLSRDFYCLLVPAIVLLMGLGRIIQGLYHQKPVTLLAMECIGFLVVVKIIIDAFSFKNRIMNTAVRKWAHNNRDNKDMLTDYSINGLPETALAAVPALLVVSSLFTHAAPVDPYMHSDSSSFWDSSSTNSCSGGSSCSSGSSCGSSCSSGCGGCGGSD